MKKSIKDLLINNKKTVIAVVITLFIWVVSITCIQPKIFNDKILKVYVVLQCVFAFFMFLLVNFILNFIDKLKEKNKTYKKWLISASIYFGIMMFVLLLIWPGHWVWDEFGVLQSSVNYKINIWQSYLTVVYMSICLMIIPIPVGIVIIQNILASMIFGYVFTKISEKFNSKIVNILLCIFMVTPAIIINNMYPLRLTMYAYIMLLFFTILIFDKIEKNKLTLLKIFKLCTLTAILILWRSEGIIFIILSPILIFITYNKNRVNILKIALLVILNLLILVTYNGGVNQLNPNIDGADELYGLTIYVNPLSQMLQKELKGKNIEKNLQDINKVLDVEILKKHPSYTEIPAFWSESKLVKADFRKHMTEFKKSYIEIVFNNLGIFLECRMKTFFATTSMYEGKSGNMPSRLLVKYMENKTGGEINTVDTFLNNYKFTKPINVDLKVKVENFLMGRNATTKEYNKAFMFIFWNFIPSIALSIICGIWSLIKKKWNYLFTFMSLLGSATIIFLTAPANYFMYYLPVYISGTIVSLIYIAERVFKAKEIKEN